MRGEGAVAGEGRVVGVPKFHSWGKCILPLTNINSDRISNTYSGLCINLCYISYAGPLFHILGCNIVHPDLEYASQVWNPYKVGEVNSLAHVQKFALHICALNFGTLAIIQLFSLPDL